ncbi:Vascular cell adhesion protein 1 [Merluccius polli]|uniref:Vascular cell adhesion protein 1 n=1 Tax=Merluccius polli TaxID=89951 RepID=A0AA47NRS4_MERPO|nr:Vascular cell adhesion protein 1 [Merluccius polli]
MNYGIGIGIHASGCPLELDPPNVVVQYGDSVSVNCIATSPVKNMGFESQQQAISFATNMSSLTWSVKNLTNWEIRANCYANLFDKSVLDGQCQIDTLITIYKFAENVTITDNKAGLATGELDEGIPHVFQCNVKDVAPAQNVTLTWHIGNRTVLTADPFKNSLGPIDLASQFKYIPRSEDNGLHIRCQVEFNLGPFGPKNLTQSSSLFLLRIRCKYDPPKRIAQLNDAELEVGSSHVLKCFSEANPPLNYHWDFYKTGNVEVRDEKGGSHLYIHNATEVNNGNYTCNAGNELNNISHTTGVTVKGGLSHCPLQVTTERLVVRHGDGYTVRCENSTGDALGNRKYIFWQVGRRQIPGGVWEVKNQTDWDLTRAECVARHAGIGECRKAVDVTLYTAIERYVVLMCLLRISIASLEEPDQVLIQSVGHMGALIGDTEYRLQCDIPNVAPVRNLIVRWYQDGHPMADKGTLYLTGRPHEKLDFYISTPVNVSSNISVSFGRNQSRVQFTCEAELDLGTHSLSNMSHSLNFSIQHKPSINSTKLQPKIPVFRGYPEELVCEADGNPAPDIHWFSQNGVLGSSGNLKVTEGGNYTCNATNVLGSNFYVVQVVLKEDYLPLIAGFVAVTVVAISIVFIFFYSIYYKNTKMRRYSLKNHKLNTENGNVAHNSLDLPIPLAKLH